MILPVLIFEIINKLRIDVIGKHEYGPEVSVGPHLGRGIPCVGRVDKIGCYSAYSTNNFSGVQFEFVTTFIIKYCQRIYYLVKQKSNIKLLIDVFGI